MEIEFNKCEKKTSIMKKLESYLSFKGKTRSSSSSSKGTDHNRKKLSRQVTPTGCFSVYVGPDKQRFVVKTEFANHPLFKMLLEDAESEYGFQNEGPLCLPCDVDLFYQVLAQIMNTGNGNNRDFDDDEGGGGLYRRKSFGYGSCSPFNPVRRLGKSEMAKGCGSYGLLTPPRLSKINTSSF